MKDLTASIIISKVNLTNVKVNPFRFTQSLDNPKLLFWRPFSIHEGEWPFIFFLKLSEGKLVTNKDLGSSI